MALVHAIEQPKIKQLLAKKLAILRLVHHLLNHPVPAAQVNLRAAVM
ncbi:hypothetical protein L965_123 [Leuconostoc pseudomesenteroides PS12]|nr:hypothetical protein L964_266 [Leuconostoc pseudomesenteroides 1159]KDA49005.1 hypothetical protein L965_123 [Leuconostoc pseudomesenteroides PS12]CCJ66292.1 hypothetical protein Q5C_00170 [Leuconostoc pseudomesenteroides 4882]